MAGTTHGTMLRPVAACSTTNSRGAYEARRNPTAGGSSSTTSIAEAAGPDLDDALFQAALARVPPTRDSGGGKYDAADNLRLAVFNPDAAEDEPNFVAADEQPHSATRSPQLRHRCRSAPRTRAIYSARPAPTTNMINLQNRRLDPDQTQHDGRTSVPPGVLCSGLHNGHGDRSLPSQSPDRPPRSIPSQHCLNNRSLASLQRKRERWQR